MASSNNFKMVAAALLIAALAGGSASPVGDRVQQAADSLGALSKLVLGKEDIGVELVVKAYKSYVDLYKMQTELGAASSAAGQEGNSAYETINKVLAAPGTNLLAETLFQPLHGAERIGSNERQLIRAAIEKMKQQLY